MSAAVVPHAGACVLVYLDAVFHMLKPTFNGPFVAQRCQWLRDPRPRLTGLQAGSDRERLIKMSFIYEIRASREIVSPASARRSPTVHALHSRVTRIHRPRWQHMVASETAITQPIPEEENAEPAEPAIMR